MEYIINRNKTIDIIKAIAILIMIIANTFPYLADFKPSIFLRLVLSLAAPLFVFMSGITVHNRSNNIRKVLLGNLAVLLAAVLIDLLIWKILPFSTFDVLYLIAISGIIQIFLPSSTRWLSILIIALIVFTQLFLFKGFYQFEMGEYRIEDVASFKFRSALKRFLIDGWFPVFPWMIYVILGRLYESKKVDIISFLMNYKLFVFFGFVLSGFFIVNSVKNDLRNGYVELFYPNTFIFLIFSLCWIAIVLIVVQKSADKISSKFTIVGKFSLTIYIFHAGLNSFLFESFNLKINEIYFFISVIILFLFFVFVANYLEKFTQSNSYKSIPHFCRKVIGI